VLLRHCRHRSSSRRRSENSGYFLAADGLRVIAAAINGVTRNHITKSWRFILPSCRMHARV